MLAYLTHHIRYNRFKMLAYTINIISVNQKCSLHHKGLTVPSPSNVLGYESKNFAHDWNRGYSKIITERDFSKIHLLNGDLKSKNRRVAPRSWDFLNELWSTQHTAHRSQLITHNSISTMYDSGHGELSFYFFLIFSCFAPLPSGLDMIIWILILFGDRNVSVAISKLSVDY